MGRVTVGAAGSSLGSTHILGSLTNNPMWLIISVVGIALIYIGLYVTQRHRLGR